MAREMNATNGRKAQQTENDKQKRLIRGRNGNAAAEAEGEIALQVDMDNAVRTSGEPVGDKKDK